MYCKDCLSFGVCRYASGSRLLEKEPCADFMDIDKWVQLPCKVETTVYTISCSVSGEGIISVCKVERFSLIGDGCLYVFVSYGHGPSCWYTAEDFGRIVFLTREEAERALKDRSGE